MYGANASAPTRFHKRTVSFADAVSDRMARAHGSRLRRVCSTYFAVDLTAAAASSFFSATCASGIPPPSQKDQLRQQPY